MKFEKSMKYANKKRTICEVIRECNDLLIGIDNMDEIDLMELNTDELKKKVEEIHNMAKRMSKKLYSYKKNWEDGFYEDNLDYKQDLKKRK